MGKCEDGHPVNRVAVSFKRVVRRRPTLPRGPPRSTIGAVGLSFRVRNGTGRFPDAMTAETLWRYPTHEPPRTTGTTPRGGWWFRGGPVVSREPHSGRVAPSVSSYRLISTGQLHAL